MDQTMSRRSVLRTTTLAALGIGLAAAHPAPVAAAPLSPADELVALLERAEQLMLTELRHDDATRGEAIDWTNRLYDLATAADPQAPATA
jgi:hypothetical protein